MRIETNAPQAVAPAAPAARARPAEDGEEGAARPLPPAEAGREKPDRVEKALGKLGEGLKHFDISLRFRRDEESGAIVIDLFDRNTGEKMRQIPTEAALHLSKVLGRMKGVVLDVQA